MNDTSELDAILEHYKEYVTGVHQGFQPYDEEVAKHALLRREQAAELRGREDERNSGHWFAREKQLDAYWNFAYYCNCGFGSGNRKAIDGHVEWKKAELQATKPEKEKV